MLSPALLRITVELLQEARLIRAAGEVEVGTVAKLKRELDSARDDAATALLDLSDVTFMDSTGLHVLLEASRDSAFSDWGFFILRPSDAVQRLIQVSGTADLLTVIDPGAERILS